MWGCSMSFPVGGVEASAAEAWRHMRALRHDPPGLAGDGGPRGRTFNAALEQAEQLFVAAAGVGTAARPILLFFTGCPRLVVLLRRRGPTPRMEG